MNNQDEIAQKVANIVLDVYQYALKNNLDITSREDVLKALKELNLNDDSTEVDTLIQGLVALDKMTKADVTKKQGEKTN
ncbi:MAG: hypothetical protein V1922_03910 [bacterium]